jgi:hypothetical protein
MRWIWMRWVHRATGIFGVWKRRQSMYLEMQLVNDPMADDDGDSKYCSSVASLDSRLDAEDDRERLVALLQCAYSWSRVQALRQVARWLAMEGGKSAAS